MGKKPLKMVSQSVLEPLTVLLPASPVEFVDAWVAALARASRAHWPGISPILRPPARYVVEAVIKRDGLFAVEEVSGCRQAKQ